MACCSPSRQTFPLRPASAHLPRLESIGFYVTPLQGHRSQSAVPASPVHSRLDCLARQVRLQGQPHQAVILSERQQYDHEVSHKRPYTSTLRSSPVLAPGLAALTTIKAGRRTAISASLDCCASRATGGAHGPKTAGVKCSGKGTFQEMARYLSLHGRGLRIGP